VLLEQKREWRVKRGGDGLSRLEKHKTQDPGPRQAGGAAGQ
jgi:hypothetical protein